MERIEGMSGLKHNKSPYVTTGTPGSAIRQGDVIPMAADSQGLEENKSKTLRPPYLTTDSTALNYDDLARSIMARWGDVIPMARCGDVIPLDRCIAVCKDLIHMAGATQVLEDNKSRNGDDLFTLSPHETTGTMLVSLPYGDRILMAGDRQGLEENKSKTLRSPYVTTGTTTEVTLNCRDGTLVTESKDRIVMCWLKDVIPMARCKAGIPMDGYTRVLKDNKSSNKDDLFPLSPYVTGAVVPAMGHGGVIPMAYDLQGLKDGALRSPYVTTDYKDAIRIMARRPYVTTGTTERTLSYRAGILMAWCKAGIPMAWCKAGIHRSPYLTTVRGTMESLPSDVVQDILSRVPAESVLDCKFVCKKWATLIREKNFKNMHYSRQLNHLHGGDDDGNDSLATNVESSLLFACCIDNPDEDIYLLFHGGHRISMDEKYVYSERLKRINHPPMHNDFMWNHLVGSCNGLVCALQDHGLVMDPIYICNPLTREYVYLPKLVVNKEDIVDPDVFLLEGGEDDLYNHTACGFGYVRSTNEYKVVRIHYLEYRVGNVEVYTLGSGCGWRAIGTVPYRMDITRMSTGTYANDTIYWTAKNQVVAFDLAKEEFRLLSVPPCMQNRRGGDRCGLVALGRHLCLHMDKLHIEIWSLIDRGDSKETWRMEFDIDYEAVVGSREWSLKPILLTKNGEIVFLRKTCELYCYNTRTSIFKMITDQASKDYFEGVDAIAHVNSFVSLEAMGENSKTYTVNTPWDVVSDELDRVALHDKTPR